MTADADDAPLSPAHPDVDVDVDVITGYASEDPVRYDVVLRHRPTGVVAIASGQTRRLAHARAWDGLLAELVLYRSGSPS